MSFGPAQYKSHCEWFIQLPRSKQTCVAFCPGYEVLNNE